MRILKGHHVETESHPQPHLIHFPPLVPPSPPITTMLCRERRSWTAKEDQLLREAVNKGSSSLSGSTRSSANKRTLPIEDPNNPNPSKWHAIAKHVPNRTNKDCRKRWFAKMASDVVKGGWSPEEDERLVKGIERYGTR